MMSSTAAFNPADMTVNGVRMRPVPRSMRKSLVLPAEPTAPENEWLYLSNLDRVVTATFSSVIHFYENAVTAERTFQQVIDGLKRSLSRVLVDFYPFAGRLEVGTDGLINLHCNDAGAVFVEAAVGVELAEVGGPQAMHVLSGLEVARLGKGPLYIPDQLTPMPTLVVQVTRFKCGAIAVATNWHHNVADGSSGVHFIKSWAEVATGQPLSLVPIHNRMLLKPRTPLNPSLVQGYSTKSAHNLNQVDLHSVHKFSGATQPPVIRSFALDAQTVRQLKSQACGAACEQDAAQRSQTFTSAESISGHLWQSMTRARRHADEASDLDRQTLSKYFMFVDGRKKLDMPAGYFGNVVCSACAVSTEEEILRNPVSYAAGLVRAACRSITADYFRSLIDWVEVQGTAPSKSEHVNSVGRDVASTFWTTFPLYEIEFGFGRPIWAARNSPPRPLIDGIAMMPSPQGQGNMVALINLHADRMERMQKDPQFSSVFVADAL
ncbi:hypothetical protein MPTK1_1g22310 [Marchantia polymorpha subsp. ruderalis]|nr:hypothetical protein MARPO_0001s0569 [Marchantia polymorpha]BBM99600.1 hypothetical protein Mp_1g22310 [Marchantia polymorpha subsp. ruderalis]|eukprot:PTQ50688.1 hypothetical protein MARPO_0001s0569 [Marchantia polymorpha]